MAGHSKWANIKHRKAAQDAKKGKVYARISREIILAAKVGGSDPQSNFRLRTAIDRAKASGLPNDTIARAVEKGSGQASGDELESMVYEGYGPGGAAIYIEAMTDNRNRTAGDIRSYFNKYNGNLGADGCVAWLFEEKGLIQIADKHLDEETVFDKAVEAGVDDVAHNDEAGVYELMTPPEELNQICETLNAMALHVSSAEVTRVPQNHTVVNEFVVAKDLVRLLMAIENHDDVQAVYTNFDIDDALMPELERVLNPQ